jgi:hypothetical protein
VTRAAGAAGAATRQKVARTACLAAAIGAFCTVATLDSGGCRYCVSDQAFYLPAVLRDVDPRLFPRDSDLLAVQPQPNLRRADALAQ